MAHTHPLQAQKTYYLEQLCSIAFCAALGVVQILIYYLPQDSDIKVLGLLLSPKFHIPVLIGGYVITAVAVIRGVMLWVKRGQTRANHACCRDQHGIITAVPVHTQNDEHNHDKSHANCCHDHGWAPWRYVVLMLPILLFLMGMPWPAEAVPDDPVEAGVEKLDFHDLRNAANTEEMRKYWEGKLVRVKGQFNPGWTDRTFTLYRWKVTCCRADAYRLNVMITSPEALRFEKLKDQWVNVTGHITFESPKGRDEYMTVLKMRSVNDVMPTSPDPRPIFD